MDATAPLRRNASRAVGAVEYAIAAGARCRAKGVAAAIDSPVDHRRASTDTDTTRLGADGEMTAGSCMKFSTTITSS